MNEDNEFALGALLVFLYTGLYPRDGYVGSKYAYAADIRALLHLKYHTEVILLADKYVLPALKELAVLNAKHYAGVLLAHQA